MTKEQAIEIIRQYECNSEHYEVCEMAIEALKQEPKTGHWISNAEDDLKISEYTCSNCKGLSDEDSDFCPKCGAKMSEVRE